jgi:DNA-binding beta-propeller fold protein YncE
VITALKRREDVDRRQFLVGAAALAAAPRAFAGGAAPLVLATADLEARVVVLDGAARVVRRIPTPAYPRSIETVGDRVVVAHSELGIVSVLDARRVRHVVRGFREPRYTAAHPDGRHAYVTDAALGEVVLLDTHTGRVRARTAVGPAARHLSLDAGTSALWVALGSKARELAVVPLSESGRPLAPERFAPALVAHDVGFAPDAAHVWVTSGDRNAIAVYTPAGRLLRTIAADWPPQHVSFGDGRTYVTSGWSGTLNLHRPGGAHLSRTVLAVGSYNVQFAAGRVVSGALGRGIVTVCDDRGRVVAARRVSRSSHDACLLSE